MQSYQNLWTICCLLSDNEPCFMFWELLLQHLREVRSTLAGSSISDPHDLAKEAGKFFFCHAALQENLHQLHQSTSFVAQSMLQSSGTTLFPCAFVTGMLKRKGPSPVKYGVCVFVPWSNTAHCSTTGTTFFPTS